MDGEERSELFAKIVREFLSGPKNGFSQKSVIDALDTLGVPAADLIQFLSQALGLNSDGSQSGSKKAEVNSLQRPLIMVSSILILSLRQLERAQSDGAIDAASGKRVFEKIQNSSVLGTRIGRKAKDGTKGGKSVLSPHQTKEADQIPGGVSSATEGDDEMDELQPLDL
jgi:hypothetical protein